MILFEDKQVVTYGYVIMKFYIKHTFIAWKMFHSSNFIRLI